MIRAEKITITHPDTGEIVVEFDDLAFEQAWETVYRESEFRGRADRPEVSIFLSQDGANWTELPVEDSGFQPNSVAFGNGSLLLIGWSEGGGFLGIGSERQQLLLVRPG